MTELAVGRPIRPVILAGGAGTRLWPLSTVERPKHLLPLLGQRSLFEQTLDRFACQRGGDCIGVASACEGTPLVVTARDDHFNHKVLCRTTHRVGCFRRRC